MSSYNERRARHGQSTINEYLKIKGESAGIVPEDQADEICDLIADLLHLAKAKGFDAQEIHDRALMHFDGETDDEDLNSDDGDDDEQA